MPVAPFGVDFLIGGTQKGGTSALAQFLGAHPEICLPKHKEVHLFDRPDFAEAASRDEINRRYRKAFARELRGRVVGEATPVYMYLPRVVVRIHRYHPAMKWILLLRHPVERALSHYSMEHARGAEWLPLPAALRVERLRLWRDQRRAAWKSSLRHHSYVDRGLYSRQIRRLWELFPREQVLILLSDDLREQHAATLEKVHRFLGLDDPTAHAPPETVFATPKKTGASAATRRWLHERFAPEIDRLEPMLGRSLAAWRDEPRAAPAPVGTTRHPRR